MVDHVALRDPVGAGVTLDHVMEFDGVVLRDDEIDADRTPLWTRWFWCPGQRL